MTQVAQVAGWPAARRARAGLARGRALTATAMREGPEPRRPAVRASRVPAARLVCVIPSSERVARAHRADCAMCVPSSV